MRRRTLVIAAFVVLALVAGAGIFAVTRPDRATGPSAPLSVESTSGPVVDRYGRWELTMAYPTRQLYNPWNEVAVDATFRSPSNRQIKARGFYFEADRYKLRFATAEVGTYSYSVTVTGPAGRRSGTGSFDVVASANPGFVRPSKANPSLLVFDDGSAFNAIGINQCLDDTNENGKLDEIQMDGGQRAPGQETDPNAAVVDIKTFLKAYGDAGFNLFRWNPGNCGFAVADRISIDGNRYLESQGKLGDQLVTTARAEGLRVLLTLFYQAPYPSAAERPREADAVRSYVDYAVARWGADVDIWELTNETEAPAGASHAAAKTDATHPVVPGSPHDTGGAQPGSAGAPTSRVISDDWLRMVADRVRADDPYFRMIMNSNPRPSDGTMFDARSPHWYETEPALDSDVSTANRIKSAGQDLPVIFGEQGNDGLNWDPESAVRMRIRSWTAFFRQGVMVFWNLSFAKDCECQGIYLGPQERGYVRALQEFTATATGAGRGALKPVEVGVGGAGVRAYGLASPETLAVYLQHFADHRSSVTASVAVDVPFDGVARWVDPATAKVLATQSVTRGPQQLTSPPFDVDAALRISRE